MITAIREHEFCYGHRVCGHESKCANLHGHNGKVAFFVASSSDIPLDMVGRVIDFSVIKEKLCAWLEVNWDHKFLLWEKDPIANKLPLGMGVVKVPFNPTAENMAYYLLHVVGPQVFKDTGVCLISVKFNETSKCAAYVTLQEVAVLDTLEDNNIE